MIRLFFIKNKLKNKNLMSNNDEKILEKYKKIAQKEKQEIIQELKTNIEKGLTNKEAEQKLEEDGENVVVKDDKHSWFYFFINSILELLEIPFITYRSLTYKFWLLRYLSNKKISQQPNIFYSICNFFIALVIGWYNTSIITKLLTP